ncbi:cyclic di-AMP binding protein CbpA [Metabacillus sp. GX 13764]|uniref:cyclic di-AMP binding protein CbpA n=1 Tax=Metabacillus kandeliae TaxID=2900151 RepID=UPI001E2908B1|nr:cyclic di-AMP binding protein CbpA [Metabacillus kandeliae]MCD7036164.1 cyclic di-AMP binding protein CbpA [Metabacillus kandeliae]
MKIRYNYVKKEAVKYCDIGSTVKDAYEMLKETGYRSIPVLSENGTKFEGLIYKVNVLEYYFEEEGKEEESISALIKDKDACINENDSFIKTFLTIRRLPFLGVLNESGEFTGILTHANIMDVLEDSFGLKTGGYLLTVATKEHKGAIKELVSTVKDVNIEGMLTLDNGDYLRRIVVNLSHDLSEKKLQKIISKLEEKDFRVTYVDDVTKKETAAAK